MMFVTSLRRVTVPVVLLGVALVVTGCESGPDVRGDYDKSVDFGKYKTYNFVSATTPNGGEFKSLAMQTIQAAASREMEARGYTKSDTPDLALNFKGKLEEKTDIESTPAPMYGAGWTMGGGPPEMAAGMVPKVRAAWREAGRAGEPRLAALAYFSLGDDAEQDSRTYLREYYAFLGPYADRIADGALRSEDALRGAVKAFEDAGITELTFDPTTTSLEQIDRLADVVL